MRYAMIIVDGVELESGFSPLPIGAIEPVMNWDDIASIPWYYLKVVDGQVVEKTQTEKDAYDEAHPPTIEELQEEAREYLETTDWFVTRLSDPSSDKAVPQEILDARSSARCIL